MSTRYREIHFEILRLIGTLLIEMVPHLKGTRGGGKSNIPEVMAVILNYCGTC